MIRWSPSSVDTEFDFKETKHYRMQRCTHQKENRRHYALNY